MVAKKLGRGLDALISKTVPQEDERLDATRIRSIDPRDIKTNRAQPRVYFDQESLDELAQSIESQGFIQPLVVRVEESGSYELVAGERRLKAALKLGLESVPALIRNVDPHHLLELALIENIQREDLNPMEVAKAYQELKDQHSWTQGELARRLGKKRSTIANTLRFLDLPAAIQESLSSGKISAGHGKVLLSVTDIETQMALFQQIQAEALSVRQLEEKVRGEESPDTEAPRARPSLKVKAPHVAEQEEILAQRLGTKVEIREGRGRGRIIIEFYSTDDFERLRAILLAGSGPRC